MSDWQYRIDLTDVWNKWPDEVSTQELSKIIATRLRELNPVGLSDFLLEEKEMIADEFEILSLDKEATVEEFDERMSDLYDWGDTSLDNDLFYGKKICWIATTF